MQNPRITSESINKCATTTCKLIVPINQSISKIIVMNCKISANPLHCRMHKKTPITLNVMPILKCISTEPLPTSMKHPCCLNITLANIQHQ